MLTGQSEELRGHQMLSVEDFEAIATVTAA